MITTHEDMQVTAAAFTPWGTQFVRMATDRTVRPFKFSYFELPDRDATRDRAAVRDRPRAARARLRAAVSAAEHARAQRRPAARAPRADAPTGSSRCRARAGDPQRVECDAIAFGDGELLVVWDAVAYRWDGTSAPVLLGDTLDAPDDLGAAVALVGWLDRRRVRPQAGARRPRRQPTTVLPLDNVMAVVRGPDDVLIIGEGDNPEADVLKLWWPASREVTYIPPELLGLDDRATFVYVDPIARLGRRGAAAELARDPAVERRSRRCRGIAERAFTAQSRRCSSSAARPRG